MKRMTPIMWMSRFLSALALPVMTAGCFQEISYTVEIDAPIEKVWNYASDSTKAKEWSVYFSHISPLPGIPDGQVGSIRRCFRRPDERGIRWDERVVEIRPEEYRQIHTFNIKGFPEPIYNSAEYRVHQRYRKISDDKSTLSFGAELIKPKWNLYALFRLAQESDEVKRIFKVNLENIKHAIEQGPNYQRLHPYEPTQRWDK